MTTLEARKWLVDVAGYAPRSNWEATQVVLEPTAEGFVEILFRQKGKKGVAAVRTRDPQEIAANVLATLPVPGE